MSVSFIKPRQKSVIGVELKWFFSITITILVIVLIASYLLREAVLQKRQDLATLYKKEQLLSKETAVILDEYTRLQKLSKMHEEIATTNRIKKENVKNFFDLVPDDVVLELAEFRDGILRLKGTTRSKKHFLKTFQRSLNSLFARSSTKFFKKKDGLYHFRNISIVEQKK